MKDRSRMQEGVEGWAGLGRRGMSERGAGAVSIRYCNSRRG